MYDRWEPPERRVSCWCAACENPIYAGEMSLNDGFSRIHRKKDCVLRFIRQNWDTVQEYGLFDALGLAEEVA